ncbi:extracellular signal-regulated kinase 1 isoform X1 [Dendrobium catenatum]|uniref:Mitogen-activated protein kinase kinase kinase 1 n=1 Tax=Dendrobium catenatum TaxID=906689 RepID=A0A2I0W1F0_9ASPA|nr:extracellular signal-regulated kinase 1 isoform X1 [Dendrobium catenatum]PKU69458.1 Mitogen-activated protein kinase kinase kinase 1 [Dendrobium catenatum]
MDRKDNLPQRVPSSSLSRQNAGGTNLTSSSSSSNSSASPPDFLRQVHAVLKHRKPLGARAVRMIDPLRKQTMSSGVLSLPLSESNAGKDVRQSLVPEGATKLTNEGSVEIGPTPNDSSLTPPSDGCTLTGVHEAKTKLNTFDLDSEMVRVRVEASLAAFSPSLELDSQVVLASDGVKQVRPSSAFNEQQKFQLDEGVSGHKVNDVDKQDLYQQGAQNMEMSSSGIPLGGTIAGSSCMTAFSVHSGPTFQCTGAPLPAQSAFPTQMVASASQNLVGILDPPRLDGKRVVISERSSMQDMQGLQNSEDIVKREVADNADCLQSQAASTIDSTSKLDIKPPQPGKAEKSSRRKKYDSNVFFNVNGKLYQKLGKIGSGGSSEVHKVISADCIIYALKKIKLKGRDYATAYGFCQEIGYLHKLKGKNNIIQLIDYEVTDKTLLQQAMEGTMTSKDGRIKDDEYIYMLLEYGEIDLAHMLMQKCKDMDSFSWNIDENWLRFYWQQMLEAVNTIHEERIVHSDLKPANFLLVRGSLKLIDFGIAKAILSDTTNIQRDAQVGTLNYMSPEAFMWNEQDQTGGTIKCGRPSDIWSLGCILYQMVYGKTPFSDYKTFWSKFKVITDMNHEISYEPVPNPWLVDLMKKCLSWDRNKRWRIPQLLQHPFLVPPVPCTVPLKEEYPYKQLSDRVELYWKEPEVRSKCAELLSVVSRLEKIHGSNNINQQHKPAS